MRKAISLVLVLAMILTGVTGVFAVGEVLEDVKGTVFEEAVIDLMEKGVITGYPDSTFRPNNTISRAEACIIVVNSMIPDAEKLSEAEDSRFPDLNGFEWAKDYIDYAVEKGVVNGYPDGTFRPGDDVTYNEMAVMLVLALGYKTQDLTGSWPQNFISKADELGIFEEVEYEGDAAAIRGHVALMSYSVVDKIKEANKDAEQPEEPADDPDYEDLAGHLADFSGRAYGIILDKADVLDGDGDIVEQVEFLIGDKILYLNTNGKFELPAISELTDDHRDGVLHGLQMTEGIVRKVDDSTTSFSAIRGDANFEDLSVGVWRRVIEYSNAVVKVYNGSEDTYISILDSASIYVAVIENDNIVEYKSGTMKDIKEKYRIRLFNVTGEDPGVAEVVLVDPRDRRR